MSPTHEQRELATAVHRLLTGVAADPTGSVSASAYETGRLVALAPWLAGHQERLDYLCRTQHPDGIWGGPDGYAVVPTLSATGGLLTELARRQDADAGADSDTDRDRALVRAARGGLRVVRRWLGPDGGPEVPDTVAVELLVPALVQELHELLPPSATDGLRWPDGFDRRSLDALRDGLTTGPTPPEPVHHCLEALGPAAAGAPFVQPAAGGVGASAAATATWLGGPDGPRASHDFLVQLQDRDRGPVPNVSPITYFEAAWVLNALATSGLPYQVPAEVLDRLEAGLTGAGAPAGPGLPADADDTAAVLSALTRHGQLRSPECLLGFRADGYFRCFPGERNPSVSTNAHVLEALALYLSHQPDGLAAVADTTAGWLLDQQQPDGSWWDKWHASPYYATYCCVVALDLHDGQGNLPAIDRAVAWLRATQRPDGSWGRWSGTVEETAYAVLILALTGVSGPVLRRGAAFLADPPLVAEQVPLWHGKDLYTPVVVVHATQLAAQYLAARRLAGHVPAPRTEPALPPLPARDQHPVLPHGLP